MTISIHARCGCGALCFEAGANPVAQIICHCTDCREATGDSSTATAFFKVDDTMITGEPSVQTFLAASGKRTARASCSLCGTVMFDTSDGFPHLIGVVLRQILPPFEGKPTCHMWVNSQVAETEIVDGLPQYAEGVTRHRNPVH